MHDNIDEALRLICEERLRQGTDEQWSDQHDDTHNAGELAVAAACYAMPKQHRDTWCVEGTNYPRAWPWHRSFWKPTPENRIRELTKAGALIVAEIERLMRISNRKEKPKAVNALVVGGTGSGRIVAIQAMSYRIRIPSMRPEPAWLDSGALAIRAMYQEETYHLSCVWVQDQQFWFLRHESLTNTEAVAMIFNNFRPMHTAEVASRSFEQISVDVESLSKDSSIHERCREFCVNAMRAVRKALRDLAVFGR